MIASTWITVRRDRGAIGQSTVLGVLRGEPERSLPNWAVLRRSRSSIARQTRLQHAAHNTPALDGLRNVALGSESRRGWAWAGDAAFARGPGRVRDRTGGDARARDAHTYGEPVELFVPTALSLARRGPVTPGLRLQAVFLTTGTDALQLSLEPSLRWRLGGGFLELRYTWNVGEPVAGERGPGGWGLHLGGGGVL